MGHAESGDVARPGIRADPVAGLRQLRDSDQDAPTFLREIVGTDDRFTTDEITNQLRNMVVSRFANILGQAKIPALDLAGNYDQLGQFLLQRIAPSSRRSGWS